MRSVGCFIHTRAVALGWVLLLPADGRGNVTRHQHRQAFPRITPPNQRVPEVTVAAPVTLRTVTLRQEQVEPLMNNLLMQLL